MRESVGGLTLCLRRYAHALLGRWPVAGERTFAARSRADQDADDLAQAALLGFWRAGLLQDAGPRQLVALRLALLRRLTRLARDFAKEADAPATCGGGRHFPWSPEARALPLLSFESRALLALAALERLDYDAIGAVLDMSADQALAGLARARGELSGALTGRRRPRLRIASDLREADLHRYADDLLEPTRREKIAAALEADEEAARRVEEWRRGAERLRGAFATLDAEPLPATLDFSRLTPAPRDLQPKKFSRRVIDWLAGAPKSVAARSNKSVATR